jgi:hypothetical protein
VTSRWLTIALPACVGLGIPLQAQGTRLGVRHLLLSVPAADSAWSSSRIIVNAGDLITVKATGTISIGRYSRNVDANGVPIGRSGGLGRVYLELRIGSAAPAPAGANSVHTVKVAGELRFRVHDERYDDNIGNFQVDVVIVPAGVIPPARDVETLAEVEPEETADAQRRDVMDLLKAFLRRLAVTEEAYFVDHARYASEVTDLQVTPQPGVEIRSIAVREDGTGWSAIVRHTEEPRVECAIAINTANPFDRSVADAQAACR